MLQIIFLTTKHQLYFLIFVSVQVVNVVLQINTPKEVSVMPNDKKRSSKSNKSGSSSDDR